MALRLLILPAWCLVLAMIACEGNTPFERQVDRFLRESGHGLVGPVGEVQNLHFEEEPGLLHVVVKNVEGHVRVRGMRHNASGPTTVRLRPRSTVEAGFSGTQVLESLAWDAQMKPQPDGSRVLEITLSLKDPSAWFIRCDVEIDTARLGRVSVDTNHGRVLVVDNRGGVNLRSSFGDIRMRTPWPITEPCRIDSKDGDVEWIVRGESSGAFDCESLGGEINVFARYGRWIAVDPRNDHDSLVSTLNGGENPIVIRVTDGDVHIVIVEDPHDVGTFIRPT